MKSLPALGTPLNLPVNCRNTQLIAGLCSNIIDKDIPTKVDAPIGDEPIVVKLENNYEVQKRVERYVDEWVNQGKLKPNQVAILCPYKLSNSSLSSINKVRGIEITGDIDR
jgi:hypothetical protein